MKKIISISIVFFAIALNLWLYRAETKIIADPNDNIFQYSLVGRTDWIWTNYACPFSFECLPNLIDHNVTYWAEGYSLPFYYSHLPQIAIVASYKLIINPLTSSLGISYSLFEYYTLTKYLLLALFPLPVFIALKLVGFPTVPSALAAFFASHYSTDGLYGIDPPSFLWRGYGLTSQLYAMFFMPLALAFIFRTLNKLSAKNFILSVLFLVLTTAGHLGIGIITVLTSLPLIFIDFNKKNIIKRSRILLFVICCLLFLLSYWIIPILLNNNYHIISFWDPIWKFDSYGTLEVIRQYLNGEIFDWGRFPVLTGIITIGAFMLLLRSGYHVLALSFMLMTVLYFGRTAWGGLIDLIPGMKDFHQHRFITGIHLTSLFLIPPFFEYIFSSFKKISNLLLSNALKTLSVIILIFLILPQTFTYNSLNHKWIYEANAAYKHEEKDFNAILEYLKNKPKGRIYAGRPGNWGKDFRLGSTQIYMLLSILGLDMSQWLPETWSMMSENDQNFDERNIHDYNLLNIKYIIAPKNQGFPSDARLVKKSGQYELYEVPTTGWFDVVESPVFVKSDKTNFINLVYSWHRGYPRTWKMHPLISVDKFPIIPEGMKRQIKMTNEITYEENGIQKNIFSDFPFVFPEGTPSAKISKEAISRQTYSATINVPNSCQNCMFMFKMSYHPSWQLEVDGTPVAKYAVFPFYVAAKATPGTHTISVTHKPNSLKIFLLFLEIITIPLFFYFYLKKKPRF